ncbi:FAD-binding protein [Ensifer aridi]|uniref:FAD-binding protein n=1 Tax=Ensifer aridi TaxID=1708715 RepID=UPI00111C852D|nr:FAD-binding protein [Ensifer aridi]
MASVAEYDVLIIGSGGGGAPIAHTLVNAGKKVLVIEKGPLFRTQRDDPMGLSDYKRDELISDGPEKILTIPELDNTGASFFTSHVEPTSMMSPISIATATAATMRPSRLHVPMRWWWHATLWWCHCDLHHSTSSCAASIRIGRTFTLM